MPCHSLGCGTVNQTQSATRIGYAKFRSRSRKRCDSRLGWSGQCDRDAGARWRFSRGLKGSNLIFCGEIFLARAGNRAQVGRMNKTNVVPFALRGQPLDNLDQRTMRWLRTMADRKGLSIVDIIDDSARLFMASNGVPREAKKNIIKFPLPLTARRGRQ